MSIQNIMIAGGTGTPYTVTISDAGTCSQIVWPFYIQTISCKTGEIIQPSSIVDSLSAAGLTLEPNPAGAHVNIAYTMPGELQVPQIKIYNVLGEIVTIIPVADHTDTKTLDMTGYAAGVYLVVLENNHRKVIAKQLIKQ